MVDNKGRHRTYVKIQCPDCRKVRSIRKDNKITGRCKSCASVFKWNEDFYRKNMVKKHLGKKMSKESKRKISNTLKGIIPKNLADIQAGQS